MGGVRLRPDCRRFAAALRQRAGLPAAAGDQGKAKAFSSVLPPRRPLRSVGRRLLDRVLYLLGNVTKPSNGANVIR